MTQYVLVKEGSVVIEPRELPRVWRNISGLHLLSKTKLKQLGWLPAKEGTASYNEHTQKLGNRKYQIKKSEVIVTYEILDLTTEEKDFYLQELKERKIQELKDYERSNEVRYFKSGKFTGQATKTNIDNLFYMTRHKQNDSDTVKFAANNKRTTLTKQEMEVIEKAMVSRKEEILDNYYTHYENIIAMTSVDDVINYNFMTGWNNQASE